MKKIVIVTPSLGGDISGGGAEKVIINIANFLQDDFKFLIIAIKNENKYEQDLDKEIKVIKLNKSRAFYSIPAIYNILNKEKPDIIFSTLSHVNFLMGFLRILFPNRVKFLARESIVLSKKNRKYKHKKFMDRLFSKSFSNFDTIICQSKDMRNDLRQNYRIKSDKLTVINNPVDVQTIKEKSKTNEKLFDKNVINLLAVGRLSHQKGYDMMFEIVAKMDKKYKLTVLGEGDHRSFLKELATKLQIEDKIKMPGFVQNPYKYMNQADVVVMTSRFEGFPNVLIEANACGTPVVAFECQGGIREIIKDNVNGFKIKPGDSFSFCSAIEKAFFLKKEKIVEHVDKNFSHHMIINQYKKIFDEL